MYGCICAQISCLILQSSNISTVLKPCRNSSMWEHFKQEGRWRCWSQGKKEEKRGVKERQWVNIEEGTFVAWPGLLERRAIVGKPGLGSISWVFMGQGGSIGDGGWTTKWLWNDLMETGRGLVVASAPIISVQTPTGGWDQHDGLGAGGGFIDDQHGLGHLGDGDDQHDGLGHFLCKGNQCWCSRALLLQKVTFMGGGL